MASLLFVLSISSHSVVGEDVTRDFERELEQAREKQRSSLHVSYNVSEAIRLFNEQFTANNMSKVSFRSASCLFDEDHVRSVKEKSQSDCKFRSSFFSNPPKNELDIIWIVLQICDHNVREASSYGSPFSNGFNSVFECLHYEYKNVLHRIFRDVGNTEYLEQFYPIIDIPPDDGCDVNWMWYLSMFESIKHAQAGQDSVLEVIFSIIETSDDPYFVEIGYNRPHLTDGSNTLDLHMKGWKGLLIDGTHENHSINLHKHYITPNNIEDIFDVHHVPLQPDYVSIDIDSTDVWVARSLLKTKYRPRVVSIEYNSNFPIASSIAMPPSGEFSWNQFDLFYGASAGSIKLMADEVGYSIVHFVGTFDIILVRNDLLNGECPPPYARFSNRVGTVQSCIIDDSRRGKWVEYSTWLSSQGNMKKARLAALHQVLPMTGLDRGARSSPACLGLVHNNDDI